MKKLEFKRFGSVLTGRPFGVQTYADIKKEIEGSAFILDFTGVTSMGSSFGEEVIVPIAKNQDNKI